MYKNCQVCGNPIFSVNDYGTDASGRLNRDYCSNCYKAGHFYTRDFTGSIDEGIPYAALFAGRSGPGFYDGTGVTGGGLY